MCELFGLSASHPVRARETPLGRFPPRGGRLADNPDGWGLAWREAGAFRVAKEARPGCDSALFAQLAETLASDLVIAHVRKARFPPVNTLGNTHPFRRACCGRTWVFAHNGLVPEIVEMEESRPERFCLPEGETDSEFAFCHLLGHLHEHLGRHVHDPADDWLAEVARISELIALGGKFNFLLSDGAYLIAFGHDRLHYLETAGAVPAVALVATEPLTDQGGWTAFAPGELRIYRAGVLVERLRTRPPEPEIKPEAAP